MCRLPSLGAAQGCTGQSVCNQFTRMFTYRTHWQLPADSVCQRCKLVWHYLTAHNCWPPCAPGNVGEPTCENVQAYGTCGAPAGPGDGAAYPGAQGQGQGLTVEADANLAACFVQPDAADRLCPAQVAGAMPAYDIRHAHVVYPFTPLALALD